VAATLHIPTSTLAEAVWNHAKYVDLANYVPEDRADLWDSVAESLNDQHFRTPLPRSFLARAGLY
jgi:hypothetical protein